MIQVRRSNERGHVNHGWLDTYHTFSFDTYHDPRFMGFRHLRVINEDRVAPGKGFPTHPHRDMDILTYILEGALQHTDSMGTGSVIRSGEVQRMSAGTGVTHSEFNASRSDPVHLLQIWIVPETRGLDPSYEQKTINRDELKNRFHLIAAKEPDQSAVKIHQDVKLYAAVLDGLPLTYALAPARHAWIQVVRGNVSLSGESMEQGDGVAISEESAIALSGSGEVLLFDLV